MPTKKMSILARMATRRSMLRGAGIMAAAFATPAQARKFKRLPGAFSPGRLTATANSDGTVSLSWHHHSGTKIVRYRIYREAANSSSAKLLATVAGTAYTDSSRALKPGSSWTYYLAASTVTNASVVLAATSVTLFQPFSPSPGLRLTLSGIPNGPLTFSEAQASDLGNYVGAFVQQKCLRQRQGPWSVYFRPDASGQRQEVVVEYGCDITFGTLPPVAPIGTTPAHITTPYTAALSGGNLASPVTITVPNHWWGARWRWQSAPRPIVRTYADLVAMKAVLPLSMQALWNTGFPAATAWGGPMSTGDLNTGLAAPGDRDELGFITEQQACTLLTGNAAAQESMLTDAEASGTMIYHVRDSATGAPLNVQQYPYLALLSDASFGSYQIPMPARPSASNYFNMVEGVSHMPPLGFVPWLLTDDPFFLEEAQFAANFDMIEENYHSYNEKLPGLVSPSQTRGYAWGCRDVMRMAAFAPASPPGWLLPPSYWRQCVANNLTFANKYLSATASPCTTYFKLLIQTGSYQTFMVDYLGIVLAWAVWSGLFPSGWSSVLDYQSTATLAMGDNTGASGWDYRYPCPYIVPVVDANLGASATLINADYTVAASSETPTSWAQLWADFQAYAAATVTNWTAPSTWPANTLWTGQDFGYVSWSRAALAAFQRAGLKQAQGEHTWLYNQLVAVNALGSASGYKLAIWPI